MSVTIGRSLDVFHLLIGSISESFHRSLKQDVLNLLTWVRFNFLSCIIRHLKADPGLKLFPLSDSDFVD